MAKKTDQKQCKKPEESQKKTGFVNTVKKIRPRYTDLITTMEMYSIDDLQKQSLIIDTKKQIMSVREFQTVVAVGEMVRDIKVGDVVCINPARFAVKRFKENSLNDGITQMNPIIDYHFPTVLIDNKPYLLLSERDISYIVEDYE